MLPQAGFHLVHKPAGPSSASLVKAFVEEVRRAGIRPDKLPACHGGALDPFAEGLLLVLAGKATRLMDQLHAIPKEYQAEIAWGAETDNGDATGKVTATGTIGDLRPAALEAALSEFIGHKEQIPPLHSNKRVGGERAYRLAWRGEQAELPPSKVYLHSATFVTQDKLHLICGGGYYVRALVRDLGRALGCRAHLRTLRRLAIGPWRDPGPETSVLVRGAALLPWLPARQLDQPEAARVQGGNPVPLGHLSPPAWPLPKGYPEATLVRGLHGDVLLSLLSERGGALLPSIRLGAGL